MLRPYFLFHRELLGELARLSYETVPEMMAAAADESASRPGMVAVIQTFGSSLKWNPHLHASFRPARSLRCALRMSIGSTTV
ncbi:MAG: transposase [Vicinamibacteria bacterium]